MSESGFLLHVLIWYAVSGIIFGGLCAFVASNKNRGSFNWFILGFFFVFIALLALTAVSRLDDKASDEKIGMPGGGLKHMGLKEPSKRRNWLIYTKYVVFVFIPLFAGFLIFLSSIIYGLYFAIQNI